MRSLCSDDTQQAHMDALISLVSKRELKAGEAWSAFSSPERTKSFTRKNQPTHRVTFTPAQISTYKAVREAAQKSLFQKCTGLCSYCRRPVGHYGWAWHIEHVLPKSKYPAYAFNLANLTVGCVHCNQWKGARIDKNVVNKDLPIINPVEDGFKYSDHLHYVQLSTDSFTFAKYLTCSSKGLRTYQDLQFSELERAQTINGLHPLTASLHERLTRAMGDGLSVDHGNELVGFLAELKSAIYR